jgi:glucose dehydrogenase
MHLMTFVLALAAVVAFRVHPSATHAFLPRRYAIAAAAAIALAAGAVVVVKDGLTFQVLSAAALLGLCALFLGYPSLQARRKQPVKPSVMLSLAACLVFGSYLQLTRSAEPVQQNTAPAAQLSTAKAVS